MKRIATLAALACLLTATATAQTLSASDPRVETAIAHVAARAVAGGAAAADVAELDVARAYVNAPTGIAHIYLVQRLDGVEVPEGSVTVGVGRDGRVFHAAGTLVAGLRAASPRRVALTPEAAAARVAVLVGLGASAFSAAERGAGAERRTVLTDGGVAAEPVTARLVYRRPEGQDALRLAWEVNLYQADTQHNWVVAVDAATGAELWRGDLVAHDTWGTADRGALEGAAEDLGPWLFEASAAMAPTSAMVGSYLVYAMPTESPSHAGSTTTDLRTTVTNPDDALASPFGWHDTNGAAGAEFTVTQGNNVSAYTDTDANNTVDVGSQPSGGAGLAFSPPLALGSAPSANRPPAVVNLFYWNNIIHDVAYQYGFTEAAGNFQTNVYGRGGTGNDHVLAEAQDGSGTNNANFSTPADGASGRMQMYTWNGGTPNRDGDFDAGIITHEYTHGISNRLTGNAVTCLQNSEQMGEGWSDFYGLMLTMRTGDTRTTNRGVGTYSLFQPTSGVGIRPAPYNTSFAVNNYTYQTTRTQAVPHGVGFVWATILWEVTWDLIDQYGFSTAIYNAGGTAGNQIALRLVTEGMALQPCSPGFVSGRDAILAADAALYPDLANPGRGLHYVRLWNAFARRGLGFGATQGSTSSNADNTEAFNVPASIPAAVAAISPAALSAALPTGGTTTRTVTIQNTAANSADLSYAAQVQNATGTPALVPAGLPPSGELVVIGAASLKGRDDDAGTGTAATLGSGGPDTFGYAWKDSNAPASPTTPTVAFQNITATGTQITTWTATGTNPAADEGYADVALPFTFPFYGAARSTVRVTTNGFLHFSAFGGDAFTNAAVPGAAQPNATIAPLWDDLDLSATGGGTVHTGTIPDGRFVVQFTSVKRWNQAASALTFEVLLSANGTIEYQYGTLTGTLNSASVGIENDAGTVGLPVAFNAAYLASNLAVRFTAPPMWALVSPAAGIVGSGGSAAVTVTFSPVGLAAGLYTANLVVTTNDPTHASTTLPVTMHVGGLAVADGAGWRMLAAPVAGMTMDNLASQNLVQGVPGYYPGAGSNLFTSYDGTTWASSTGTGEALTSGRGMIWYLYDVAINPGGPSQSVALPMTLTAPTTGSEPTANVAISLHTAGNKYNLVGNPFLSSLDVSGLSTWATGGALNSAVGQVFDPTLGSYRLTTTMANKIASWQGMLIENNTATGLTIPTSARTTGGVFQGILTDTRMVAFELEGANAQTGTALFDRAIVLYFHPDAVEAWDLWDASKLTPLSSAYAVLAFEGSRDGSAVLKAQESRPFDPTAAFDVPMALEAVGTGTEFTLRWPTLVNVPDTWSFSLEDLATGATTDLRTTDHYTFTATPGAARTTDAAVPNAPESALTPTTRFVMHVSPGVATDSGPAALPTSFALGVPAPNPAADAAALRYDVPLAADVTVEVFDLLGRRVATLVDGPVAAGRHQARLDAGALAAGVYVVRMRSGDFVQARRLTIAR